MIKLTPSSIGVMVDTLRYSGLANGVKEFPILVRNHKEKAKILSKYASPLSSLHFEPLNLFFAITGEKYPL